MQNPDPFNADQETAAALSDHQLDAASGGAMSISTTVVETDQQHATKDRKQMLQWYKAMQESGKD